MSKTYQMENKKQAEDNANYLQILLGEKGFSSKKITTKKTIKITADDGKSIIFKF